MRAQQSFRLRQQGAAEGEAPIRQAAAVKYCHACNAQFPDDHRRCLHCGGRLESGSPAQAAPSPSDGPEPSELVLLARRQPAKAVSLLEELQAAEIEFEVIGEAGTDQVNIFFGSSGIHAAVEVYVRPRDLDQAQAIIRAELSPLLTEPSFDSLESDVCPGCKQQLPDQATECPECGLCFAG